MRDASDSNGEYTRRTLASSVAACPRVNEEIRMRAYKQNFHVFPIICQLSNYRRIIRNRISNGEKIY